MAVKVKLVFSTDEYEEEVFDAPEGVMLRQYGNMIIDPNGKTIGTKKVSRSRRKAEIEMLKALAEAAFRKKDSKMADINTASDLWAQFDSLTDEVEIELVESDTDMLKKALEEMGEQRNTAWCRYCSKMISQISSPGKVQ